MGQSFTPGLRASEFAVLTKRRELPIAGEILVSKGQSVGAAQFVARASLQGELRIVRVAEQLGVPAVDVSKAFKVKIGESVVAGQVLAELVGLWGLFRSTSTSPIAGEVEFITESTGHLAIRAAPKVLNLPAYVSGHVEEIDPGRAVIIETSGTFVQGIFGVGGERVGILEALKLRPDEIVTEERIPKDCKGKILVGGHSPTRSAIKRAVDGGAVGLIVGSIDDQTLHHYVGFDIGVAITGDEDIPMTLIVTEGFGTIAMGERVFKLLQKVSGNECSINGTTQVRAGAIRPEIIVPTEEKSAVNTSVKETPSSLEIGGRIRLIRVPYFGEIGIVAELPHEPERIETGTVTRVLRATLEDGRVVTVPRANVECI